MRYLGLQVWKVKYWPWRLIEVEEAWKYSILRKAVSFFIFPKKVCMHENWYSHWMQNAPTTTAVTHFARIEAFYHYRFMICGSGGSRVARGSGLQLTGSRLGGGRLSGGGDGGDGCGGTGLGGGSSSCRGSSRRTWSNIELWWEISISSFSVYLPMYICVNDWKCWLGKIDLKMSLDSWKNRYFAYLFIIVDF